MNTVQSFWAVFNNIPSVSAVQVSIFFNIFFIININIQTYINYFCQVRYSYHLMRDERYPLWEEPVNQNGGTWRLKCHKSDTVNIKFFYIIYKISYYI